jgi:hypothetical protein
MHLRGLMAKGDMDALMAEYEATIRVGVQAYGTPYQTVRDNTREDLTEFLHSKPDLGFGPGDLELRPWCGGRIWELTRRGKKNFLQTADGSWLQAFVGLRNGRLRVVR